jgi:hypothetical protein
MELILTTFVGSGWWLVQTEAPWRKNNKEECKNPLLDGTQELKGIQTPLSSNTITNSPYNTRGKWKVSALCLGTQTNKEKIVTNCLKTILPPITKAYVNKHTSLNNNTCYCFSIHTHQTHHPRKGKRELPSFQPKFLAIITNYFLQNWQLFIILSKSLH